LRQGASRRFSTAGEGRRALLDIDLPTRGSVRSVRLPTLTVVA
jgi:hypothetical protein